MSRRRASELPAGEEKARAVRSMFDTIAGRYDLVNRVMTFGLDVGWRRRAVRSLALPRGALVLDLACGTGDFCVELARAGHRAIGFDFAWGMLANARTEAPLAQADALRLPVADASADGVTCGFALRNVTSLDALLAEIARVVRPGGRIALLETATPRSGIARAGHSVYVNRVVPMIGGMLSDRAAYQYLPRSSAYLPAPADLRAMLERSGFTHLVRYTLLLGSAQLITGSRA